MCVTSFIHTNIAHPLQTLDPKEASSTPGGLNASTLIQAKLGLASLCVNSGSGPRPVPSSFSGGQSFLI